MLSLTNDQIIENLTAYSMDIFSRMFGYLPEYQRTKVKQEFISLPLGMRFMLISRIYFDNPIGKEGAYAASEIAKAIFNLHPEEIDNNVSEINEILTNVVSKINNILEDMNVYQ